MPNITVQLVHIQGPLKGQIQDFSDFPVNIGRHSSCQVRFEKDLTTISRRHARIERQGNRFRIVDASTNGTYVNGKRIADVYLRDGDVITFSENGPKASFLTKIETGNVPIASTPGPQPTQQPIPPAAPAPEPPPPVAPPATPSPEPSHGFNPVQHTEPGLTVGPDVELPVISANAPLVVQFGPTLQSYNLLPVTIGSDPSCDFVIAEERIAGQHIQIFYAENEYYAKDLTGRDMVSINGRPIGLQTVLAQGAELSLGEKGPTFRFLGGGRLAEVAEPQADDLAKTDAVDNVDESAPSVPKKKASKSGSLFKNFFK
jgi:pSer/pThr/pTyr-binding forkhead associated (FHA) protein